MKLVKSKLTAVLALMLLVGQVAASPLLMCIEMSEMNLEPDCHAAVVADSGMAQMMDSHAGHLMDAPEVLVSDHGSSHGDSPLCELCASCSSATGSYAGSANAEIALSSDGGSYDNALIHIARTNPFRPPIAA